MNQLLALDAALLWKVQDWFSSPLLDRIMPAVTHLGDGGIFWLLLAALLLLRPATRRAGASVLLAMALCLLVGNGLLKPLIARPRPYAADPSILLLISPSPDPFSFPSGHTMHSVAAACSIGLSGNRRLFLAMLPLALLIGFSRVYLMMHYPLDVLAGALLGVGGALAAHKILPLLPGFGDRRKKSA